MIDQLDKIPWNKLRAFYKITAEGVPRLLKRLLSDDLSVREKAAAALECELTAQGELYEAAPYAVPFLLWLIEERYPGAQQAYQTLWELGNVRAVAPEVSNFRLPGWDYEVLSLRDACREAVRSGMDLYIRDVADASIAYHRGALELLAEFYIDDERARKTLPGLVEVEPDPVLRAEILELINENTPGRG